MKINPISTQPNFAGIYQVKVNNKDVMAFEKSIAPLYATYKNSSIKAYRGLEALYVFTDSDAEKFKQEWKSFQQSYLGDNFGIVNPKFIHYGTAYQNRTFGDYISEKTVETINGMQILMSKLLG